MNFKRVLKNIIVFVAMMLILVINIVPTVSKASSKGYGLAFDYDQDIDYTNTEDKNTYSSVGMTCTYSETSSAYYVARVFGVDGERFDYSHGYEYTFYEGTSQNMLNWVRENGCSKACVRGIGYNIDSEYGTVFTGEWSPDLY